MFRKFLDILSSFHLKYFKEVFIFLLATFLSGGILAARILLKEERKLPLQFISPVPSLAPSPTESVLGVEQKAKSLVNINTASFWQLDQLAGIGLVRAQKIIDGRPYSKIEELKTRKILPVSVYERIKGQITVD